MYGIKAFLIFVGFAAVAAAFLTGLFAAWKNRRKARGSTAGLIGIAVFVLLWVSLISSVYIRKARFHYELWKLNAADVYSIRIGKHDFRDRAAIDDLVAALRHNRWFEVNHGGWGDSIPLTVRRRSGSDIVIDVALYFREPAAIIGPANPQGLGYSATEAFAPDLPRALEKYAVKLPDCDTAHRKLCTPSQLNP